MSLSADELCSSPSRVDDGVAPSTWGVIVFLVFLAVMLIGDAVLTLFAMLSALSGGPKLAVRLRAVETKIDVLQKGLRLGKSHGFLT